MLQLPPNVPLASAPNISQTKRMSFYTNSYSRLPCPPGSRRLFNCFRGALSCAAPTAYTFQLDGARTPVRVTDLKCRAREVFLEEGQLPRPQAGGGGGRNPLLDLWNDNYAVEIFYFAASSLEITNLSRYTYKQGCAKVVLVSPHDGCLHRGST